MAIASSTCQLTRPLSIGTRRLRESRQPVRHSASRAQFVRGARVAEGDFHSRRAVRRWLARCGAAPGRLPRARRRHQRRRRRAPRRRLSRRRSQQADAVCRRVIRCRVLDRRHRAPRGSVCVPARTAPRAETGRNSDPDHAEHRGVEIAGEIFRERLRETERNPFHHIALGTLADLRYALHTSGFRLASVGHTHIRPISFLYAWLVPWMWLYTAMAFRKEKDDVQRRANREVRSALFSMSVLFGENLLLIANRAK
jgi:hypothetical protein